MQNIVGAFAVATAVCLISGLLLIPFLRRLKFRQQVRSDGPEAHLRKAGTPTMGGVMFFISLPLALLWAGGTGSRTVMLLLVTCGFGLIGFFDDYIKIVMQRPLGLKAREKLLSQIFLSAIFAFVIVTYGARGTEVFIPGTSYGVDLGWFFIPFAVLVMVSANNAVNLTDGLDGLAAGTMIFAALAYLLLTRAWHLTDLAVFSAALLGSCIGFLFFNLHPARLFMGDTGSLALGGAIGALAVITKTELLLLVIGGVFVVETISVIIQVLYFRMTGGKRFFRMAPLHHHFELSGWREWKVVLVFWTASAAFASLAIIIML